MAMAEPEAFDQFVTNVLRETWELFRREALIFVVAAVVLTAVSVLSLGLVAGPVSIGFIEMVRRCRRGEPLRLGLLFSRFDTFVPSLVALIIIVIAVCFGTMLLVLPGLLAMLFTAWTLHVLAYEEAGGIEALQHSFDLVRANFVQTVALLLLMSIAHALGSLVVFGLLLTAPLSLIAMTVGYERLTDEQPSDEVLPA
jgi:hypothetical protein